MPVHLRPVGPLPETVYWRRRAGVVAVLLLLLVLLTRCGGDDDGPLAQRGAVPGASPSAAPGPSVPPGPTSSPSASANPSPTASPSPSADPSPSASASPSPSASPVVAACPDGSLSVRAAADRGRYALGARPVLRLSVRNKGAGACTRPLGQGAVELTVLSGSDRIWSSDDCAPGGPPGPVLLRPQELHVITLTWGGRRSRPGCPDGAEAIGAGTYRVVGRVGTLRSAALPFVVS